MNKEHGQVTGIIWRGPDDLAIYQQLKEYADKKRYFSFKGSQAIN